LIIEHNVVNAMEDIYDSFIDIIDMFGPNSLSAKELQKKEEYLKQYASSFLYKRKPSTKRPVGQN